MSVKLDPQYGCTLKIGANKALTDEAVVHVNGDHAVAYAWVTPEEGEGGMEIVGRLRDVTSEDRKGKNDGVIVLNGIDEVTGQPEKWTISEGRPCKTC